MRQAIAAVFIICFLFAGASAARIESIAIVSEYGWGEDERALQSVWLVSGRNGKYYAGDKEISSKAVARLETALAAARMPAPNLANLRVNQAWLNRNAAPAFPECCATNGISATEARRWRGLFDKDFRNLRLMEGIIDEYIRRMYADENRMVEITIKRANETIRWNSVGQAAFMLPWQIENADNKYLVTYNADISRAVAALLPANFANRDLLAGTNLRRDVSSLVMMAVFDRMQEKPKTEATRKPRARRRALAAVNKAGAVAD